MPASHRPHIPRFPVSRRSACGGLRRTDTGVGVRDKLGSKHRPSNVVLYEHPALSNRLASVGVVLTGLRSNLYGPGWFMPGPARYRRCPSTVYGRRFRLQLLS